MLRNRLWRHFSTTIPTDDEARAGILRSACLHYLLQMILRESVDSLTEEELEEATKERGLCLHENLDPPDLRAQLRVRFIRVRL